TLFTASSPVNYGAAATLEAAFTGSANGKGYVTPGDIEIGNGTAGSGPMTEDTEFTLTVTNLAGSAVKTAPVPVLVGPRNVEALAGQPREKAVQLSWTNPADPNRSSILVSWTPPDGAGSIPLGKDATGVLVDGLVNGTVYELTVNTIRDTGSTEILSSGVSISVTPTAPPPNVDDLKAAPCNRQINLGWKEPASADYLGAHVYCKVTATGTSCGDERLAAGTMAYSKSGLDNDTDYTFTVRSIGDQDNESIGVAVTARPTAIWTEIPMNAGRNLAPAVQVGDGRVLISGGLNRGNLDSLASSEVFDPSGSIFIPSGNMTNARAAHTMTLTPNGAVLAAGGWLNDASVPVYPYKPVPQTELWMNPAWDDSAPDLLPARGWAQAVILNSGKVMVAGGDTVFWNNCTNTARLYDMTTGLWSSANPMNICREHFSMTRLGNGTVLAVGGQSTGGTATAEVELYNPSANSWTSKAPLPAAISEHTAVALYGGKKVLVFGGQPADGSFNLKTYLYDSDLNTWETVGNMPYAPAWFPAVMLPSGKVFTAGGFTGSAVENTAEAATYDPASKQWTKVPVDMPVSVRGNSAMLLESGKVLVSGGALDSTHSSARAYIFDGAEAAAPAPNADILLNSPTEHAGTDFTANIVDTTGATYIWMVENGTLKYNINTSMVIITAGVPGELKIHVIVISDLGIQARRSASITVIP
ncbi:MAG: kelch repeat-containing protein, partial [Myxococcota bacterium]